jgi:hypothetical protein
LWSRISSLSSRISSSKSLTRDRSDGPALSFRTEDTAQVQGCTLLHELLHAVFATFPCLPEGVDEEALITALEMPLAGVIRDNRFLFNDILLALTGDQPIFKEPT